MTIPEADLNSVLQLWNVGYISPHGGATLLVAASADHSQEKKAERTKPPGWCGCSERESGGGTRRADNDPGLDDADRCYELLVSIITSSGIWLRIHVMYPCTSTAVDKYRSTNGWICQTARQPSRITQRLFFAREEIKSSVGTTVFRRSLQQITVNSAVHSQL